MRQVSLRTFLLLTAAVAVWIAHAKNRHDNEHVATQIKSLRPMARELMIEDPSLITVVKKEERWYDQNDWSVYLPEGSYRLCLATRDVAEGGLAPVSESISLSQGTHDIVLEQKRLEDKSWRTVVLLNGAEVLRVEEPANWNSGHGSTGGGQFSTSTQLPVNEPVMLFRRRFSVKTATGSHNTPKGPANGTLLWIERAESAPAAEALK